MQYFGNNFCVFDLRLVKPYTAGRAALVVRRNRHRSPLWRRERGAVNAAAPPWSSEFQSEGRRFRGMGCSASINVEPGPAAVDTSNNSVLLLLQNSARVPAGKVGKSEADMERASRTIYIGNVPVHHANPQKLLETFEWCGVPQVCKVHTKNPGDPLSGETSSGSWALLTFKTQADVNVALNNTWTVVDEAGKNEAVLDVQPVDIDRCMTGPLSGHLAVKQWGCASP